MFLALPSLSPEIPASLKFGSASKNLLDLMRLLVDAGHVVDDDLAGAVQPLTGEAVLEVLEASLRRNAETSMEYKSISTGVSLALNVYSWGEPQILLSVASDRQPEVVFVEKLFIALEAISPGMGRFALFVLEDCCSAGEVGMTPIGANFMGDLIYGWDREEEDEEEEEEDDSSPDKETIFAGLPQSAHEIDQEKLPVLSLDEARAATSKIAGGPLKTFCESIVFLAEEYGRSNDSLVGDYDEGISFDYPAIIRWNENDALYRVFDDFYANAAQGETRDHLSEFVVPANIEGINKMVEKIKLFARFYTALDTAISIVTDFENDLYR